MSSSQHRKPDVKSIVIGVLVAFLVLDLMYSYSVRKSMSAPEKAVDAMSTGSGLVAIVVAIMIGALVWYLFSRS